MPHSRVITIEAKPFAPVCDRVVVTDVSWPPVAAKAVDTENGLVVSITKVACAGATD